MDFKGREVIASHAHQSAEPGDAVAVWLSAQIAEPRVWYSLEKGDMREKISGSTIFFPGGPRCYHSTSDLTAMAWVIAI